MIDRREKQIYKAMTEQRKLLFSNVTAEQARELARTEGLPEGNVWLWAAEAIYGPKGSARTVSSNDREAAE
jgi:hypothetical protein